MMACANASNILGEATSASGNTSIEAMRGGITGEQAMRDNLRMHCIPDSMLDGEIKDFNDFLEERRKLMALKVKAWFEIL